MEQAATVNVGSSTNNLKKISVTFPQAFATIPVVVANTLQDDPRYPTGSITDTFAVSITSATKTGFTANIYRVDNPGPGWGQNLLGISPRHRKAQD